MIHDWIIRTSWRENYSGYIFMPFLFFDPNEGSAYLSIPFFLGRRLLPCRYMFAATDARE